MSLSRLIATFANAGEPAERMDVIDAVAQLDLASWDSAASFLADVLLHDPDPVVRHEAAFALGELQRHGQITGSRGEEELCLAASKDLSVLVRHEAAEALYCFPGARCEVVLKELLNDESEDVRLTAAISLAWRKEHFGELATS